MSPPGLGGAGYRMPTIFGSSPGPRFRPDGKPWTRDEVTGNVSRMWVSIRTDPEPLQRLLPPGLALEAPIVTVSAMYLRDLWWLAGRGYNILAVSLPVTTQPPFEELDGDLMAVLWENLGDPIITGREELGFPKLWADIPDLERSGDSAYASASWGGFRFAEIELHELVEQTLQKPPYRPSIAVKYVPRTGEPGANDAAYFTTNAPPPGASLIETQPEIRSRVWSGTGQSRFHHATFEQLPTLLNIVNRLAEFEVRSIESAGLAETVGEDLRAANQRVLQTKVREPV